MSMPGPVTSGWERDFPPLEGDLPFPPDPVIEAYKRHVDRTLLRENLRRTPAERFRNLQAWQRQIAAMRPGARSLRHV